MLLDVTFTNALLQDVLGENLCQFVYQLCRDAPLHGDTVMAIGGTLELFGLHTVTDCCKTTEM